MASPILNQRSSESPGQRATVDARCPPERLGRRGDMRVKGDDELQQIERLLKDGKRYEQGNLVILIFAQEAS